MCPPRYLPDYTWLCSHNDLIEQPRLTVSAAGAGASPPLSRLVARFHPGGTATRANTPPLDGLEKGGGGGRPRHTQERTPPPPTPHPCWRHKYLLAHPPPKRVRCSGRAGEGGRGLLWGGATCRVGCRLTSVTRCAAAQWLSFEGHGLPRDQLLTPVSVLSISILYLHYSFGHFFGGVRSCTWRPDLVCFARSVVLDSSLAIPSAGAFQAVRSLLLSPSVGGL